MRTKTAVIIAAFCILSGGASAVDLLTLDIGGGVYVGGTDESIFNVSNPFDLYALVNMDAPAYDSSETYYLAVAIVPRTDPGDSAFGSFDIDGMTYTSADMTYGTPPLGLTSNPGLLGPHEIYETHFLELSFTDLPGLATMYNSEDNPGGPTDDAAGTMAYRAFEVDISALAEGLSLHFDLYTLNHKGGIDSKAPFSHDAQSGPPPRPPYSVTDGGATLALLGLALVGIDRIRRKAS